VTALDLVVLILPFLFVPVLLRKRRREREPLGRTLGVAVDRRSLPQMGVGFAVGGAVMLAVFLFALAVGATRITGVAGPNLAWWRWLFFLVVAAGFEELLNRAILLNGLVVLLGKREWIAIALSAILFGLAHAGNPNATLSSVVGNSLGGVMYAVAFLGTGRIWMPWALHLSWNFFQGQVFGWPVSGLVIPGFFQQSAAGPDWLTGGAYGPEGGVAGHVARFAVLAALFAYLKLRNPTKSWTDILLFR
jgi:membrane protease YdiL (CAAX protease family)